MDFRICPRCNNICDIMPISTYDSKGEKIGGIFSCRKCRWHDLDYLLTPEQIKKIKDQSEEKVL